MTKNDLAIAPVLTAMRVVSAPSHPSTTARRFVRFFPPQMAWQKQAMPAEFPDHFHKIVEIGCTETVTGPSATAAAAAAHKATTGASVAVTSTVAAVFALGGERRQRVIVVVSEMPHRPKVASTRDVEQPRGVAP